MRLIKQVKLLFFGRNYRIETSGHRCCQKRALRDDTDGQALQRNEYHHHWPIDG